MKRARRLTYILVVGAALLAALMVSSVLDDDLLIGILIGFSLALPVALLVSLAALRDVAPERDDATMVVIQPAQWMDSTLYLETPEVV